MCATKNLKPYFVHWCKFMYRSTYEFIAFIYVFGDVPTGFHPGPQKAVSSSPFFPVEGLPKGIESLRRIWRGPVRSLNHSFTSPLRQKKDTKKSTCIPFAIRFAFFDLVAVFRWECLEECIYFDDGVELMADFFWDQIFSEE